MIDLLANPRWMTRKEMIPRVCILAGLQCAGFLFFIVVTHGSIWPLQHADSVDFVSFYSAGLAANHGHPGLAYDPAAHYALEQAVTARGIHYQYFFYPPVFLLILAPFATLPYIPAFFAFEIATLVPFLLVVRRTLREAGWHWLAVTLGFAPIWWILGLGQNAFLTSGLIGGGLLLMERQPFIAGLLFSGMIFKPHLALLIPVALLAGRNWRCLAGAAAGAAVLVGASLFLHGWETWQHYLVTFAASRDGYTSGTVTKFMALATPYGTARALGAGNAIALGLQAGASLLAIAVVSLAWFRQIAFPLRAAVLLSAAVIAAPIALFYELPLVFLAMCWLVRYGRDQGFPPWSKMVLAICYALPVLFVGSVLLKVPLSGIFAPAVLLLSVWWAGSGSLSFQLNNLTSPDTSVRNPNERFA